MRIREENPQMRIQKRDAKGNDALESLYSDERPKSIRSANAAAYFNAL
jgi:hypothetical protein